MARVYMIRHGSPAGAWGGDSADPGLDERGHGQAEAAAAKLLALAGAPEAVASSPLRRCRETAAPFARALGLEPRIDTSVAEIPTPSALTPLERRAWLQTAFGGVWADIKGDIDYEVWRQQVAASVAAAAGTAVFSHFVAINAAVSVATGDPRVLCFEPSHASITVFETDGARLRLVERGDQAETTITL